MTIRALQPEDVPRLESMGAESGYEYLDLRGPHIASVRVVLDEYGDIITAGAAESIVQLFLWASRNHDPVTKLNALKMLHQTMAEDLRGLGYNQADIFLPPQIEKVFGRRMERTFGWRQNWKSWFLNF